MKTLSHGSHIFMVVIIGLALLATAARAEEHKYSGFLDNYKDLTPGPEGGVKMRYRKPGVDFSKYNKIMLDSVVFFLADDAKYKGIDPNELKELSDQFNQDAVKALGDRYPLVSEPGPDVMRIRVAITNLEPSKPGLATVTTVVPVGLVASLVRKAVTGKYTGVGGAGMEMEALDSTTNERIAAAVDERPGGKFSGMSKWGAAKDAFEFWAKRLRTMLDRAHGINPAPEEDAED